MPELPEVETVCHNLRRFILYQKIVSFYHNNLSLRYSWQNNLAKKLSNATVIEIVRRGKYFFWHMDNDYSVICHLGMTGMWSKAENYDDIAVKKHVHIVCELGQKNYVYYHDPRRFGMFIIVKTKDLLQHRALKNIGCDLLSQDFCYDLVINKLGKMTSNIKTALLNQKLFAGVGNIYACEALFVAGINPHTICKNLSKQKIILLIATIKQIITKAISFQGSTISSYKSSDGKSMGSFQNELLVYGKNKLNCDCSKPNHNIVKVFIGGRATYFCPIKQKI